MNTKNWKLLLPVASLTVLLPQACNKGEAADTEGTAGESSAGQGGDVPVSIGTGGQPFVVAPSSGGRKAVGSGGGGAREGAGGTIGSLALCTISGQRSVGDPLGTPLFDDFDDGDAGFSHNGLMGGWYAYDDESGGEQIPTGSVIEPTLGGLSEDGFALRVRGSDFTAWGSGFGANFAARGPGEECLFDASAYAGISFWVRGRIEPDGIVPAGEEGKLRVQIIEKDVSPVEEGGNCDGLSGACWDSHRVRIEPTECWTKHSLPFDEFVADGWGMSGGELDTDELYLLGFEVSNGQGYDLWIDQIEFFVGQPSEESPRCVGEGFGGAGGEGGAGP